jgi:hypothetical protein
MTSNISAQDHGAEDFLLPLLLFALSEEAVHVKHLSRDFVSGIDIWTHL